jgi:hypothetical protein
MSAPFQPGDVVVCVDDRPLRWGCIGNSPVTPLRRGSFFRVTAIVWTLEGDSILIDGERPHTCLCCDGESGWHPERFRKIDDEVEEVFREQMRALGKPKVIEAPRLNPALPEPVA